MTFILGITGSIAMGKSTVACMFAEFGAMVSDADALVHQILEEDTELITAIGKQFPNAVIDGVVNRLALGREVFADDAKLKELEKLLHPKIRAKNVALIEQAKAKDCKLLVQDIPLLFETGADEMCDAVLVVTANADIQRARVLSREGMTEEKFEQILNRQMPDAEKREKADYIIDTSNGIEDARAQVAALISKL